MKYVILSYFIGESTFLSFCFVLSYFVPMRLILSSSNSYKFPLAIFRFRFSSNISHRWLKINEDLSMFQILVE